MRLGRNVLAGLTSSIWSALVGLAVVPIYLRQLGVAAYGLIGIFATLQAVLQILDLGLAPTVNREVARAAAEGAPARAADLVHTLALVYWSAAALIGGAVVLAAPALASGWLRSEGLPTEVVTRSLRLMGLVLACRWPAGLYLGALMGTERLTLAAVVNAAGTAISNVGAVVVLALVSPTLPVFFLWQAVAGLAHAFCMRWAAWRALGGRGSRSFHAGELKRVWRFSAGMSGLALYGLAFTQLDKVVLSRLVQLEEFGRYMLATTISSGLYVVTTPVFNALYPRFTAHVARDDREGLSILYRRWGRLLSAALFPLAAVLLFFGQDVVQLWTGDPALAHTVAPIAGLLSFGAALHGIMYLPYALQLAAGRTDLALRINTVLLLVQVPILVALSTRFGALGAAASWLTLHVLYVAVGTWLTHRYLLRGLGWRWLLQDVGQPFALSVGLALAGRAALGASQLSALSRVAVAMLLALCACALSIFTATRPRAAALTRT